MLIAGWLEHHGDGEQETGWLELRSGNPRPGVGHDALSVVAMMAAGAFRARIVPARIIVARPAIALRRGTRVLEKVRVLVPA